MKRVIIGIFAAVALLLTGCSAQEDPEVYEPAYFGSDKDEVCYFVEDPEEVVALKEDNLCEKDWRPAPWPEDDLAGFFPFFFFVGDFDGKKHHYTHRYVPTKSHGKYKSKLTTLNSNPAFKTKVGRLSKVAPYKSSKTGKVVSGGKVSTSSFGSSRAITGGGARPRGCAAGGGSVEITLTKGGSSGGSRGGGSFGGGSRSGSGSKGTSGGSKTGTKSGTSTNKQGTTYKC